MDGSETRRYVVTFASEHPETGEVASVLGMETEGVLGAFSALSGDQPIATENAFASAEMGVAAAPMTVEKAETLRGDPRVLGIEEDREFHIWPSTDDTRDVIWGLQITPEGLRGVPIETEVQPDQPDQPDQPIPWNISMVNAPGVWHRAKGRGVKVAVLDTGIDDDHPDLQVAGGVSFVGGTASWNDDNGHGTHCTGTVAARNNEEGVVGVAPNVSLYAVKVLNGGGSGSLSQILAGMEWALNNGMDVVSMSLGAAVTSPDAPCSAAYQRAAERLNAQGIVIVAAAGNSGDTPTPWVGQPARCPGYIAVAAVDRNRKKAGFSSSGEGNIVAISAPGVDINSTWVGGGYRELKGTSMACPHVAGAAALLKEVHPDWDVAQIRDRLVSTASDLGSPGIDPETGAGLLNCKRAVLG